MTLQTPSYRPAAGEEAAPGSATPPRTGGLRALAQRHLSKLVVAPSFAAILLFVYGFIVWTAPSRMRRGCACTRCTAAAPAFACRNTSCHCY
ncbi:hypothetical protein [Azospirillum sp. B506]|uniref:hypothetical protein n=1 Tax=Azospirillum sp. B506 TaxID=137721 RepID=UPI0003450072|nr:hypothetical protein [Azospirillum sp. B506]